RIIKDLWFRFYTLKQNKVIFRPGWDTQGLPVELQAEKELGLTGNKTENIDKVGIEKIVETCKSIVEKYNKKWIKVDQLLGMSFDYDNAYWTFHDDYIEKEWLYLKTAWENGILQEGFRVVAYCPSCQTSLSNSEVNQGYKTVEDPSFYYKVKLVDEDAYLIVWTTMPFTLVTDELVGVNPEANYVYVETNKQLWIIGEDRLKDLMNELHIENYNIKKIIRGDQLDGKYYIHPLLDLIPELKKLANSQSIHFVVSEDFVDTTTGSGIVHLSPANGEEDFSIAKKRNIPIFVPIDDRVMFTEQAGVFSGSFVRDVDERIVQIMKELNASIKIGKVKHQYPTCWRSHHKLVWLARREYFYMIDKLGDKSIEAANRVEYFFEAPKNRFTEIIKEKVPWCISRERIWGTPLPIWVCTNCGQKELIYDKKGLLSKSCNLDLDKNGKIILKSEKYNFKAKNLHYSINNNYDGDQKHFELHRPWIDQVQIKCSNCESLMTREQYVLDTWHNSGAAPFASLNNKDYNELIPALFLTEGIDQTRGWSYSLLILNVILKNEPIAPFKSFLFQGHVLDEKGNKMSKSAGNVIEANLMLESNPVDLVRFYFVWKSSPIEALNFSVKEMISRPYQVLSTLYYLHLYLKQNSILDNFDRNVHNLRWVIDNNLLQLPEKWLLSVLQNLIKDVSISFENCRFHEGTKAIEEFIINNISQTYIPMTRNYIWNDNIEQINRRLTIFAILDFVLEKIDIILHPVSPFITEYLYLSCFTKMKTLHEFDFGSRLSLLLCKWPDLNESLVDKKIENIFEIIKTILSLANSARMKAKIKRRWPIREIIICYFSEKQRSSYYKNNINNNVDSIFDQLLIDLSREDISEILKNQLNVQTYRIIQIYASNKVEKILEMMKANLPILPSIKIIRKNIAPKVKSDINKVMTEFEKLDKRKVLENIKELNKLHLIYDEISSSSIDIDENDLEISFSIYDNYVYTEKENLIIFLPTTRDQNLIIQGLVRDLARNLQQLRKEKSYNPTEILSTAYISNLKNNEISYLFKHISDLTYLVRVKTIVLSEEEKEGVQYKNVDIDGRKLSISIN
ncbi:MAG TPA: class I tRNA ligase family protein, partial [Nitrososphaeraceae archaeon]|nr:class I tRNA ligase family protein [Nitrososphaeraceae archaeon]